MEPKFKILDKVVTKLSNFKNIFTITDIEGSNKPIYTVYAPNGIVLKLVESDLIYVGRDVEKSKYDLLKMYVLVKNTAPIGLGINAVGHVTFLAANAFNSHEFAEWQTKSFRKVTCLVSPVEFDEAISEINNINGEYIVFNENDWGCQDISVAFSPMYKFPDIFRTFKLHSGAA